jgi:putative peptidoglycan lipid II flippase
MERIKKIFSNKKNDENVANHFEYVALGIAFILLLTKITAIVKLLALTSVYGFRSIERDIFIAANTLPEFIYTIIVIGGINAALIPVLNQTNLNESQERQKNVFSSLVNIYFVFMSIVGVIIFFLADSIVRTALDLRMINIQNSLTQDQTQLFIDILRILIFSPIILSVSSVFSSILQVKRKFWITAAAPFFYNIGIIIATLLLPYFKNDIKILGYGVIIASFLHLFIQLPAAFQSKIEYRLFFIDLKDKYIIQAIRQTIPRSLGLAIEYVGNIFQVLIGITLTGGSLSAHSTATSIRDMPISVFGLSVAQSVYPDMTELAIKNKIKELVDLSIKALSTILFWTIPITAIFIVLRTPITRILFGIIAEISLAETRLVSLCMLFVSLSIVPMALLFIVTRIYYSLGDVKTPTIISFFTIIIEVVLSFAFVNLFSHFDVGLTLDPIYIISNIYNYFQNENSPAAVAGLGLATFIAMSLNLLAQILLIKRKGVDLFITKRYFLNKLIAFLLMIAIGFFATKYLDSFFATDKVVGLVFFTLNILLIMLGVYLLILKLLKDQEIHILDNPIKVIKKVKERIVTILKKIPIPSVGS